MDTKVTLQSLIKSLIATNEFFGKLYKHLTTPKQTQQE